MFGISIDVKFILLHTLRDFRTCAQRHGEVAVINALGSEAAVCTHVTVITQ